MSLKFENFTNPWSPDHTIMQSRLVRTQRPTERSASFRFGKKMPRYLHFYNPNKFNKWGHKKGYRIQFNSHAHSVLPRGWQEENGISWSRYGHPGLLLLARQSEYWDLTNIITLPEESTNLYLCL